MKKTYYLFIAIFFIFSINILSVKGLNINLNSNKTNFNFSESYSINATLSSKNKISLEIISLFIMYDNDKITINKIKTNSKFKCIDSCNYDGCIGLTLKCNNIEINSTSIIPLLSITFETANESSFTDDSIKTMIYFKDVEACDNNNNRIKQINTFPFKLTIDKPKKHNCLLKSLIPSVGNLEPNFDPNIFDYCMDVEHNIKEITFSVEVLDPESTFKINRKRLYKAGDSTNIQVTVSNKKAKTKQIYNILVNRKTKPEEPKPTIQKAITIKKTPKPTNIKRKIVKDLPPPEEEEKDPPCCLLNSLSPFFGVLTPDFDPNIFDYVVNVGSDIKKLEFDFDTINPNAHARATKKRLGKAGTSTNIDIIVKVGKTKQVYSIVVNRAEKPIISTQKEIEENKKKKTKKNKRKYKKYKKKYKKNKKKSDNKNKILKTVFNSSNNKISNKTSSTTKRDNLVVNNDQFVPFISGLLSTITIAFVVYIITKIRKNISEKTKSSNNKTSYDIIPPQ